MTIKTSFLVVGAGINGLLTSYFLVKRGFKDIVVIDEKYPGSGGTYRCATGIRASFTSPEHVEAMKRSIEYWPKLAEELGFDYRRDGYLWLLSRDEDVEAFKKIIEFHHQHGVPTRMVDPSEIKEIVPSLRLEGIIAGVYDPLAGKADNFWALLKVLEYLYKHGARVFYSTKATRIIASGNRVKGVETTRGVIEADNVIITAGHGSRDLLKTVGIDIPTQNIPKHALITEAYKYTIKPLLIDWTTGAYIVQVIHGGILMGVDIEEEPNTIPVNRIDFLYRIFKIWVKYFPWLGELRILRYWTGYYVMTPDHHPIIGPVEEYENLYIATGYSGHGFMMAPVTAEAIVDYITEGKPRLRIMENLKLERFKKGKLIKEIAVIG